MKRNLYRLISDRVVNAVRAVQAYIRPWARTSLPSLPTNAVTGRSYRAINAVLLTVEAMERGYSDNRWMTYRQAQSLGANVRRREHGVMVVFRATNADIPDANECPALREYVVFNVGQIVGLPRKVWRHADILPPRFDAARSLIRASGVACAGPILPGAEVADPGRVLSEQLHALAHWSGASARLDRDLGYRFGEDALLAEELVAEVAAAMTCAALCFSGRLQHAALVARWCALLSEDHQAIVDIARFAQHASDYLLRLDWDSIDL